MATMTLEERVVMLEQELKLIKNRLPASSVQQTLPWWEKIAGTFADNEDYDEAMRLGREYRASLRPETDVNTK